MTAFLLGPSQYHCPTTAFIQWPSMMASSCVGGGKWKRLKAAAFWLFWAVWEFQAPVYMPASESQKAFCHSASVNHQGLSLAVAKSNGTMEPGHLPSPRPQVTFAMRSTSASYKRRWYFPPQLQDTSWLLQSWCNQNIPTICHWCLISMSTHGRKVAEEALGSRIKPCSNFTKDICNTIFASQSLLVASQILSLMHQSQEEHSRQRSSVVYYSWLMIRTTIWKIRM